MTPRTHPSLPGLALEAQHLLRCRPHRVVLNCDASRLGVVDFNGTFSLLDTHVSQGRAWSHGPCQANAHSSQDACCRARVACLTSRARAPSLAAEGRATGGGTPGGTRASAWRCSDCRRVPAGYHRGAPAPGTAGEARCSRRGAMAWRRAGRGGVPTMVPNVLSGGQWLAACCPPAP